MVDDEISEAGREARFAQWEKLGVDAIEQDLATGGHRLVGGPLQVRALAREWVQLKKAAAQQGGPAASEPSAKPGELLTLKPSIYGVGIDLKEAGRRIRRRVQKWRGQV
jgi:hypothetical protein